MRFCFLPAAAIALALAWPVRASPLALPDALRLAEQRSRLLPAQEAAAETARQMGISAGRRPDPVLKAGINNLPPTAPTVSASRATS